MKQTFVYVLAVLSLGAAPLASATAPVGGSPGGERELRVIGDLWPTFDWSAVEAASGYELVVFEVSKNTGGAMVGAGMPALSVVIPAAATAWSPSAWQKLAPGRKYGWSVRAITAEGAGSWSEPLLFQVAATAGQRRDEPGSSVFGMERDSAVLDEASVEREGVAEGSMAAGEEPVGLVPTGQLIIEEPSDALAPAVRTRAPGSPSLRVDDKNVLTAGDVQIQVRTASVGEAAFTPRKANEEMEMGFSQGGAYLETIVGDEGGLIAPVTLPDGARITRFSAHSWDDTNVGGENLTIRLQRIFLNSGGYENVATVSTFAGGGVVEDFTFLSHTVDNTVGAYQVFVTGAVANDRRIRAVEITYEISGI